MIIMFFHFVVALVCLTGIFYIVRDILWYKNYKRLSYNERKRLKDREMIPPK